MNTLCVIDVLIARYQPGLHERKLFMNTNIMFSLSLLMTGLLGDTANSVLAQDEKAPAAEASADPAATALAGTVCPRYVWMNHGSYYSYYSQKVSDCAPVNFDSTSDSLSTAGDCVTGGGTTCYQTLVRKNERGERVDRADDPGVNGYGHGLPAGGKGKKRYVHPHPWPVLPGLELQHVDDFEINFLSADGKTTLQAQVMVVEAKVAGSSDPITSKMALIARAIEIHPRPDVFFEPPTAGTVGDVSAIPGRPHAFTFNYTRSADGTILPIEIITHHATLDHAI